MTALENAEKIVVQLSPGELAPFHQWFTEFDGDIGTRSSSLRSERRPQTEPN